MFIDSTRSIQMKIQILKKRNTKGASSDPCPYIIEVPPEAAKK